MRIKGMKRVVLALMLFAAFTAGAQLIGPEESLGPYTPATTESEPAFAVARHAVLMTWAERDPFRIQLELLDFNARLASPIVSVTESEVPRHVVAASDGSSFLVAYSTPSRIYAFVVDSSGRPITQPRHIGWISAGAPPKIVWNGHHYLLWAGGQRFAIAPDGTIAASGLAAAPAAVVAVNGALTTAGWKSTINWNCYLPWWCFPNETWDLVWTTGDQEGNLRVARPAAALSLGANESEAVAVWPEANGIQPLLITGAKAKMLPAMTTIPAGGSGDLSIACDASECLIASATTISDIYGFTYDLEQHKQNAPFPIALGGRREHHPQVHALGSGRFLVAYLSSLPGEERIVRRIVATRSSRHRAVR